MVFLLHNLVARNRIDSVPAILIVLFPSCLFLASLHSLLALVLRKVEFALLNLPKNPLGTTFACRSFTIALKRPWAKPTGSVSWPICWFLFLGRLQIFDIFNHPIESISPTVFLLY